MSRIGLFFVLVLGALPFTTSAHADDLETFRLDATTASGGTLSGTVTLDLTPTVTCDPGLGCFTFWAGDASANVGYYNSTGAFLRTLVSDSFFGYNDASVGLGVIDAADAFALTLYLPSPSPDSLVGYAGGICTTTYECDGNYSSMYNPDANSFDPVVSGTFIPVSATPEPSTLALLGTGALVFAGAMRRRRV